MVHTFLFTHCFLFYCHCRINNHFNKIEIRRYTIPKRKVKSSVQCLPLFLSYKMTATKQNSVMYRISICCVLKNLNGTSSDEPSTQKRQIKACQFNQSKRENHPIQFSDSQQEISAGQKTFSFLCSTPYAIFSIQVLSTWGNGIRPPN